MSNQSQGLRHAGKACSLAATPLAQQRHKNATQPFQASWETLDWGCLCVSMCASPNFDLISMLSALQMELFYFKYRGNCSYVDF